MGSHLIACENQVLVIVKAILSQFKFEFVKQPIEVGVRSSAKGYWPMVPLWVNVAFAESAVSGVGSDSNSV